MMYTRLSVLTAVVGLALSGSPVNAQAIDCSAQSAGLEPAGYAAQCGPFNTTPGPEATNAPTDMGTAVDFRGDTLPADTLLNFTINDFPGMTAGAATNNRLFALDYDETGTVIYGIPGTTATANANTLVSIDPTTGIATPIAPLTGAPNANGLTIDPMTGAAYIVDATNFYSLDLTTGVATLIGVTDAAALMVDVAMNCEGLVYGHDIGGDNLYSIDPLTGAGTIVGGTGLAANFAQGMDFDNDDGTLYGFVYTGGGTNTFGSFNLATGAVVALSTNNPTGEFAGAFPGTCPPMDADVSVTKTAAAPNPLLVGSTVTYTLTAANAGPGDAADVVVTDSLPALLTYVSNTCAAAVAGQDVTWTIGTLANGANATCDIATTVNNFGPISNTANIASSTMDLVPANNSATASLGGVPFPADVAIALSSDAPAGSIAVGTQFNYTVDGSNAGPGVANDLAFTLQLSGKVSFISSSCGAVSAGGAVTWSVATLGIGATTSCVITVAVVAPGDLLATASVTTSTVDPNLLNNTTDLVVGFVATQVPTLGQLGLLLLGLILAGAAVVVIRR